MSVAVTFLKGVKGARGRQLKELGVETVDDLVRLAPRYYEDRTHVVSAAELTEGIAVTLVVRIMRVSFRQIDRKRSVLNVFAEDDTGRVNIVFFNQRYNRDKFEKGATAMFFGRPTKGYRGLELVNPEYVILTGDRPSSGTQAEEFRGIWPVYPLTAGLSQKLLRKFIKEALELLPPVKDTLPAEIAAGLGLMSEDRAIRAVHRPETLAEAEQARRRLAFDELLETRLMLMMMKQSYSGADDGIAFKDTDLPRDLIAQLPFALTDSQEAVWREIQADMAVKRPMNRLVMGDVGSGKTVLAMLAMLKAAGNGCQTAYMAPTEVLAEQHYANIAPLFGKLGVSCALLTGAATPKVRADVLERIAAGKVLCVIGTHALIQSGVNWHRLGLAVTDEQHRFGVRQRGTFLEQSGRGKTPDVMVMTATPIPRTLGMILYGDMDISRVETLPTGRLPIITYLDDGKRRERIYTWAAKLAREGQQVYVVHAAIGGNDETDPDLPAEDGGFEPDGSASDLRTATDNYNDCSSTYFAGIPTALLHGKLPDKEKNDIMRRFAAGEIKVLFSTTVIEVGVDVPNATLMIVENSERFGLAQLHQLRGRVGRGRQQSYCVLLTDHRIDPKPAEDDLISRRLLTLRDCTSGEKIAEEDLKLRGPGDFFGESQHGLPAFRAANLYGDKDLLAASEAAAQRLITAGDKYRDYLEYVRKKLPGVTVL